MGDSAAKHSPRRFKKFVPEAALLPMNVWKRIAKLVVVCQYHELFQKPASFHPCAHWSAGLLFRHGASHFFGVVCAFSTRA